MKHYTLYIIMLSLVISSCNSKKEETIHEQKLGEYYYVQNYQKRYGLGEIYHIDRDCPSIDKKKPLRRDYVNSYSSESAIENECPTCIDDSTHMWIDRIAKSVKNRRELYRVLLEKYYGLGTFEQFCDALDDSSRLQRLYNDLKTDYDSEEEAIDKLGTFEQFSSKYGSNADYYMPK